jgi:hypothetical protein
LLAEDYYALGYKDHTGNDLTLPAFPHGIRRPAKTMTSLGPCNNKEGPTKGTTVKQALDQL